MKRRITVTILSIPVAVVLLAATSAFPYGGDTHLWAGGQSVWLFTHDVDLSDPTCIGSDHGGWPIYPELLLQSYSWDPESSYSAGDEEDRTYCYYNWEWIKRCSKAADDATMTTVWHFWYLSDGLHDLPQGWASDNSWEVGYLLWIQALSAWNSGDLGWAYTNLGYCMHHIQDFLQPSHSNQDVHPSDDAIENWFLDIDTNPPSGSGAMNMYSWDGSTGPPPGPEIPFPSGIGHGNDDLLQDIYNAGCWDPSCDWPVTEEIGDFPFLTEPYLPHNMQKFFYLMYWSNQFGNYFASDDEDGDDFEPVGWLEGFPGFPTELHDEDGNPVSVHSMDGLVDNDSSCENGNPTGRCRAGECDCDGDLSLIAQWCYGAAFKASPALIMLFRTTVDVHSPVTTTEIWRADGLPVVEWNNSPVTVVLTDAVDEANPGFRPSGVWWKYGECDGNPPADINNPSFLISEDGKHLVKCLSTDWCGNIEHGNEIDVWVDMTPPEVTFPDLRPNYLTSEDFTATWVAFDATSGVASEIAYLDGHQVTNGQVFDLALMAGLHTLRVIAADKATNWTDVTFQFEVFIDATSWAKPVLLGDKTKGTGLYCAVEFPAPYNVALINVKKCTLVVKGTLDLSAIDPVVGGTAILKAENITGVGDSNSNKIRDRMLRFNKESFVAALGGQTGMIHSVVRGGLGTGGMPRFLAVVQIPVFAPPPGK